MNKKLMYRLFPVLLVVMLALSSAVYADSDIAVNNINVDAEIVSDEVFDIEEASNSDEENAADEGVNAPEALPVDVSGMTEEEIYEALELSDIGIAPMYMALVSNFEQLKNAVEDAEASSIIILNDIQMEETLTIDRSITMGALSNITLTSPQGSEDAYARHFIIGNDYGTAVTLDMTSITLDGGNYSGGVAAYNVPLTITGMNSAIMNCDTEDGAVYGENSVTLKNITIKDNSAIHSGGGVSANGGLTVTASTISGNTAAYGGGIHARAGVSIDDTTISGNRTTNGQYGHGGGIFIGPYWEWESHRSADIEAAPNSVAYPSVSITNSSFEWNEGQDGGAVYIGPYNYWVSFDNTQIIYNTSSGYGGGIEAQNMNSSLDIKNSLINSNTAVLGGGGIHGSTRLNVTNSEITTNSTAGDGGGILIYDNPIFLSEAGISYNESGGKGGGIYIIYDPAAYYYPQINLSEISFNKANNGGGMYADFYSVAWMSEDTPIQPLVAASVISVSNSVVKDNEAVLDGGGIYKVGGYPLELYSTGLTGNTAGNDGGAVYSQYLDQLGADEEVVFGGNKAGSGYFMTNTNDIALHTSNIKATAFSSPFTEYAYNNYDINYTKGDELIFVNIKFYEAISDQNDDPAIDNPYAVTTVYVGQALGDGEIPADPEHTLLKFIGWADKDDVSFDADTVITEDMIEDAVDQEGKTVKAVNLYACWKLK